MQEPQITYRHMEHSPAMDARIAELAGKLETLNPRITSCHVIVTQGDRHKTKGNQFEVHVVLHVPGRGEVVATRQSHEDPYLAANEAFDVVTRELEKEIEMLRGNVKRHTDERGDNALP
ncbi:MAG TPA: HPF/RaiA family ribosome-associated protein [Usitatibacter sp.]|nr:HPF/RaiA family ribosome-associated protein [Usitatibacter sp.]